MLAPLGQVLSLWDDTMIEPGGRWKADIERALAGSKAAVLLVSADFLASEFIRERELPRLLKDAKRNGLRILWIHVSASLFSKTPIKNYQALHDIKKPLDQLPKARWRAALSHIADKIDEAARAFAGD